jgi:hypothetical protein
VAAHHHEVTSESTTAATSLELHSNKKLPTAE